MRVSFDTGEKYDIDAESDTDAATLALGKYVEEKGTEVTSSLSFFSSTHTYTRWSAGTTAGDVWLQVYDSDGTPRCPTDEPNLRGSVWLEDDE